MKQFLSYREHPIGGIGLYSSRMAASTRYNVVHLTSHNITAYLL